MAERLKGVGWAFAPAANGNGPNGSGEAVEVEPMNSRLKTPGTQRLKPKRYCFA